jgi:hypothetical protein
MPVLQLAMMLKVPEEVGVAEVAPEELSWERLSEALGLERLFGGLD